MVWEKSAVPNRQRIACSMGAFLISFAHLSNAQAGARESDAPLSPSETSPVIVTGSRMAVETSEIERRVISISGDSIDLRSNVNIEDLLGELPQFGAGADATTNPLGGGGYASLNLRGLGEQRNLVLLNGRRLPAASARGVIDVNIIPTIALERIEVSTSGASDVYGSDAISGVVNFRFHDQFTGFKAAVINRISARADGSQNEIAAMGGTRFLGDRAHIMVAASFSTRASLRV